MRVDCKRCGAVQTLMPFDLLMRCGTVPLSDLQPRLRCRRCRHRQAKMSWMPPF